jgi:hypothetical protein
MISVIAIFIFSVTAITNNASKLQFYDMDEDNIATINYVLGERKISNLSSEVVDNVMFKQYTYCKIDNVIDDIQNYIDYLCEKEEFIIITKMSPVNIEGQAVLRKKSTTKGTEILVTIDYFQGGYIISLEKVQK